MEGVRVRWSCAPRQVRRCGVISRPGHFRDRIWPELVFQSFDRIWPNRIWPELVFLVLWPSVCVCVGVCVCVQDFGGCLQDFWWGSSDFWASPLDPPSPGPPPPPDRPLCRTAQHFALFFSLPPQFSSFLLSLGGPCVQFWWCF